ncbi:L-lactate dehydrogenase [Mycolicibacterium sp.]|uniref:L-lactate dehydrogenase n=1 Tax=Mycolicibacterium sp. TaxID=2320850 RepID=UPI0028ADB1B4|nr:L-lactate dehydrogenase [Mycolicibacterium sp.]
MSEQRTSKVSIVGVGSVGTAIAYACMIRGSAGAIALYDMAAKKVHAEVLDLNHGSQFVPNCVVTGSDSMEVTADSSVVIITAGAAQKPGQTRLELAATNVGIVQSMMPQLLEHSPNAIFIFVTNPVDIVTLAAARSVDIEPGRIFGSGTVLDSSRFRYLIAKRAGVDVGNVHGVIVGEHGDSEIPLWSSVSIGGVPALQWRDVAGNLVFDDTTREQIAYGVVNAAYEIIEGKGATNLAIGLSSARIIEAVLSDEQRVLPISTVQTGAYQLKDVALALPTLVSRSGAGQVLEVPLSVNELLGLQSSAKTLAEIRDSLQL